MEFKTPNVNDLILQNKQLVELLEQTNHVIIKKNKRYCQPNK